METKNKMRVGVFDSGIGGLTVLRDCVFLMPQTTFYYYGDNLRAPYGNRTNGEIMKFTREAMERFKEMNVDAVVLACNTATAVCIDKLRKQYDFPIVGVEPAVKTAAAHCRRALLLATKRTSESDRVKRLVKQCPECRFTIFAPQNLAGAIERSVLYGQGFDLKKELPVGEYDGVVLGCTHYLYFEKEIAAFYKAPVYDGNFGVVKRLAQVLGQQNSLILGIENHQLPPIKLKQMYGKFENMIISDIYFLGKTAEMNENVFYTNVCFKNI